MVWNCSAQGKSGFEHQALSCRSKITRDRRCRPGRAEGFSWASELEMEFFFPPLRAKSGMCFSVCVCVCVCVCVLQHPQRIFLLYLYLGLLDRSFFPYFIFPRSWMCLFFHWLNTSFVLRGINEEKELYFFPFFFFSPLQWCCSWGQRRKNQYALIVGRFGLIKYLG